MLFINYKGNIPQQRFYSFAVKGNHNANKVRFVLARKQADIDLTNYICNLKVENQEVHYKDLIMLDLVKESESELVFEWTMSNKSTQFRNIELQLEFLSTENESEVVWQTMIVGLELSETIKVGDERPTDKELSILKQLEVEVKSYDNRITKNAEDIEALQEEVETKDNIIIGNPEEHLNEQGLKKIIRPVDDNGNVNKSFMVDKIHHESTIVEAVADTEGAIDDEYMEGDFDWFVDIFGGDLSGIFGEEISCEELDNTYIVNKEYEDKRTYGIRFGAYDFSNYGSIQLEGCEPNKIIRVIVGKYFEYDEQGNKVFDEHCVLYSDCFVENPDDEYREITEERQVFELKSDNDGRFYFDSDGGDLGFGNTRLILYGFETGEPAYDEYEPKELGSGTSYFETTYAELKQLRDNSQLVKGALYRITDYVTTAIQKESKSAGHQFDIIIQALSKNVLSENARVVNHSGDTYFENCNLSSWEIKYCLDNDTTRFAWALNGQAITNLNSYRSKGRALVRQPSFDNQNADTNYNEYQFAWGVEGDVEDNDHADFIYSKNATLSNEEIVFNAFDSELQTAEVVEGKGVIYYMKDEWNNECPYDFKNIQFRRYYVEVGTSSCTDFDGLYVGIKDEFGNTVPAGYSLFEDNYIWVYTFTGKDTSSEEPVYYDMSAHPFKLPQEVITYLEDSYSETDTQDLCRNNKITERFFEFFQGDIYYNGRINLNNIVFFGESYYKGEPEDWNWLVSFCYANTFGTDCYSNTFGRNCSKNTFGTDCSDNTFGTDFNYNIFDNGCYSNTFGRNCYSNIFRYDCRNNTFGKNCHSNTFGNNCYGTTFDNGCHSNTFGDNCDNNIFGLDCYSNIIGNFCARNTFGDDCKFNIFGGNCSYNTFGDSCYSNTFGDNCIYNIFGNTSSLMSYYQNIILDNGCVFLDIVGNGTASSSNRLQNIHIHLGVKGTDNSNHKTITVDRGLAYTTDVYSVGSIEMFI